MIKIYQVLKHQIKKCFFVIIIVCIYFLQWSLFMHKICASCSLYITYIICILLYTNIVSGWGQHWLCKPWGTRFCLMRIERQYIRPPPPHLFCCEKIPNKSKIKKNWAWIFVYLDLYSENITYHNQNYFYESVPVFTVQIRSSIIDIFCEANLDVI